MRKLYVIDTSVLIHDPECIYKFGGNDVAIPIFVIIELDDLKEKKTGRLSFMSRAASRTIQEIKGTDGDLRKGVILEDLDIMVQVIGTTGGVGIQALQEQNPRKMDLWIMQSALDMQKEYDKVVLVTKDLNLRLLSQGEGLESEDYENDLVPLKELHTGFREIGENQLCPEIYFPENRILSYELVEEPIANEFYVGSWAGKNHLFQNKSGYVIPVGKDQKTSIQARNLEQRMAIQLLMDPDVKLVSLIGKAGTGKTIIALACAVAQVHMQYEQIVLTKPIIDMGNSIGFLPGDLDEKLAPWMASYFDNLDKLFPHKTQVGKKLERNWRYLLDTNMLVVQPLNSIRGRSIDKAFMIIDEAQNLTAHEIKTIITRAGEGTKVVLMGDPYQVDSQFLDQNSNGLTYVTDKMKGSEIFGSVFFSQGVRSELAAEAADRL